MFDSITPPTSPPTAAPHMVHSVCHTLLKTQVWIHLLRERKREYMHTFIDVTPKLWNNLEKLHETRFFFASFHPFFCNTDLSMVCYLQCPLALSLKILLYTGQVLFFLELLLWLLNLCVSLHILRTDWNNLFISPLQEEMNTLPFSLFICSFPKKKKKRKNPPHPELKYQFQIDILTLWCRVFHSSPSVFQFAFSQQFHSGLLPLNSAVSSSCDSRTIPSVSGSLEPKAVPITSKVFSYFTVIHCCVQQPRSYAVSPSGCCLHSSCQKKIIHLQN